MTHLWHGLAPLDPGLSGAPANRRTVLARPVVDLSLYRHRSEGKLVGRE